MSPPDNDRSLTRRLLTAIAVLAATLATATGILWILGRSHLHAKAWSLADCAYHIAITVTTVGFGELPHMAEVPGARFFTSLVAFFGLGTTVYAVSLFAVYFIEGTFWRERQRRKGKRMIDKITDHIIVCGVGTTGIHVVEELSKTGHPVVAIDVDARHLERAQALSTEFLPTIQGDATEDAILERAGIRRARGLVAALTDDKANLFIVVTARELNPSLRIVAKGVEVKAAEKLRHAGADRVVNPAYIGGVRMVSEMIRPEVVDFIDGMLRDKERTLRIEEVIVPDGSPLAGKPISAAQIRQHTNLLVIALRDPAGRFFYNPSPDTIIDVGMTLIVLGESPAAHKLRRAMSEGFRS